MLPVPFSAHADGAARARLGAHLPGLQAVVRLDVGACGCAFLLERAPQDHSDEAHLRRRYRALGLARAATIRALERHRRSALIAPAPRAERLDRLAGFLAEHARNAGPALCLHTFGADPHVPPAAAAAPHATRTLAEAVATGWGAEDALVLVTR